MIERLRGLLGCLLLCGALGHAQASEPEPVQLTTAQTLEIEGYGYSAPSTTVQASSLAGEWKEVHLPHATVRQTLPETGERRTRGTPTLATWYRLHLPELPPTADTRYLYIPRVKSDGQVAVYADQRLLYQSHASILWNTWNLPLWLALGQTSTGDSPREVLLRIERPREGVMALSTVWLGEASELSWRFHLRHLLQVDLPYMSSVTFLAAGFLALFWFRQQRKPLLLLFFVASLASFLRTLHYHVGEHHLLVSDEWFSWVTVNSLFWLIAIAHFFMNHLHGAPLPGLNRAVMSITVLTSVLTFPALTGLPDVYALSSLAYIVLMIMGTTVGAVGFFQSRKQASRDGMWLGAWCLLGMLLWLYDWFLQTNRINIEGVYLGPYTNFLVLALLMKILLSRYVGALDEVKQVNASLEHRLLLREAELLASHRAQREISHRQMLAEERQRMTQDMHDGMGLSLRTALLEVERGRLDGTMVAEVLRGCIDDLKLAIDAMEPVQPDLLLLLATLRFRLAPRLENAGLHLRWEIQDVPALDWLDPRNALHILRILQEAFTNIIKHTRATEIRVATGVEDGWIVVSVTDNGPGFEVNAVSNGPGRGLGNQRSRAQAIGAKVHWTSSAVGTQLVLRLPIKQGS